MNRFPIALLTLGLVLIPLASAAHAAAPRATLPEPVKDVETVAKGEVIRHVFEIKNEGDATLEVTDVRPACGCTVAEFDKKIAPGKIGHVTAKVDTASFAGPIAKTIAVFTNDPDNPKLQLVIKADVKPYLGVTPGYARFNYVQGEPIEPIRQLLWAEDGRDLKIVEVKLPHDNVKSPHDYVKVSQREATAEERDKEHPGKQWVFDIIIDPYTPVGALRDYVEIVVDHPKQPSALIPLSGFVRPRQHVTPQEVDFGSLESAALPKQFVLALSNFIAAPITVGQIETGIEGLNAEVRPAGSNPNDVGHRFEILLTASPNMPKGEFKSTMKLHINDEQHPVVEVPVQGTIL